MAAHAQAQRREGSAWGIVFGQELRNLWLGGRGLMLIFGFTLLLSVIGYLAATNTELNFLEQRESTSLLVQVAIGVGALLALLVAADAFSGERERGTLESVLLTPAPRLSLTGGKLAAALSVWFAAFVVAIPYIWFLGRDVEITGKALLGGLLVGTLMAVFLASLGIIISVFARSNRVSLSLSLFLLLAFFAPTQLPAPAQRGWAGELLIRVNPVTAGEHYVGRLVINDRPWSTEAWWLISPFVAAIGLLVVALLVGARFMRLRSAV